MLESFGNRVKIKNSPITVEKGLAGKIGDVYDQIILPIIDFEIIGTPAEGFVVNVYFDDLKTSFWFEASLLENFDDVLGTDIRIVL